MIASTIVVLGREAFSPTEATVRRIAAYTPPPRRLVVVDGGSPRTTAGRLECLARELDFTLMRADAVLSANESRNLGLAHVTTEFVVFVDNDLIVAPGWLEGLERCARETGGEFVTPVVLWGPTGLDEVHFAGGTCRIVDIDGTPRLEDRGTRMHLPTTTVGNMTREPTELVELHCLLARRTCLERIGPFDEAFIAGREETDLSLFAARHGWTAWLEPAVVTGYPSPKRLRPSDYLYYLPRWSDAWSDRSFRAFHQKWGLGDHATGEPFRRGHRMRRIGRWPGPQPGWRGRRARVAWRARRALDLVVTPAAVAVADRRRRRAGPARIVHAASWDATGSPPRRVRSDGEECSVTDAPTTTTTDVLDGVDLSGRTVLVTGATTGIGKETARAIAASGASVTITARSDDKGTAAIDDLRAAAPDAEVAYELLELGSLMSVRDFTDRFAATHDRLDLLIANAGIMAVPFGRTDDGFELHFGTNHLAHFVLVGRLLPLLTASAPARVVVLTSAGHAMSDIDWDDPNYEHRPYSKMEAYGQSKTANILHAVELERRYGPHGVHAYAVHPGMVATELARYFTREDMQELRERAKSSPSGGGGLPSVVGVEVGAATSVWAATAPELDDEGGTYLADCAVAVPSAYSVDPDAARRLWSLSEQLVGEHFPEP